MKPGVTCVVWLLTAVLAATIVAPPIVGALGFLAMLITGKL